MNCCRFTTITLILAFILPLLAITLTMLRTASSLDDCLHVLVLELMTFAQIVSYAVSKMLWFLQYLLGGQVAGMVAVAYFLCACGLFVLTQALTTKSKPSH